MATLAPQFRQRRRRKTPADWWLTYEERKRQWERENPDASPAERDRAIKRIADELGL